MKKLLSFFSAFLVTTTTAAATTACGASSIDKNLIDLQAVLLDQNLLKKVKLNMPQYIVKDHYITKQDALKVKDLKLGIFDYSGPSISSMVGLDVFKNLETVNLSGNKLTTVDANVLNNLPKLRSLDLSFDKHFTDLSPLAKVTATNLESLFLGGDQIALVQQDYFKGFHNLQTLDLSAQYDDDNHSVLSNVDFLQQPTLATLRDLDLSSNAISEIPKSAFSRLKGLQKLSLRGQTNLTSLWFLSALPEDNHLETLDLSNNSIIEITAKDFINCSHLKDLNLSTQTRISGGDQARTLLNVDNLQTAPFQSLETLNLSFNGLITVNVGTFDNMTNLKNLDLSYQGSAIPGYAGLSKLTDTHFLLNQNLEQLLTLNLAGNWNAFSASQEITISDFADLISLTSLDLTNNNLVDIHAFHDVNPTSLQHLTDLKLMGNVITTIKGNKTTIDGTGDLDGLMALNKLDLKDNKISMDSPTWDYIKTLEVRDHATGWDSDEVKQSQNV